MAKYIVVSLAFVAAAIAVTSAASQEEYDAISAAVMPIFDACHKESLVSKDDLKPIEWKDGDAIRSCYYACAYKKMGFLNEEGLFDAAVANETKTKFLSNEDDIQKASELTETCVSVNDEPVSDGAKGCDRAKLLNTCFLKELKDYNLLPAESEE